MPTRAAYAARFFDTDFAGSDQKDYSTDGDEGGFNFKGAYGKDFTSDDHGKWRNHVAGVPGVRRMHFPKSDPGRHRLLVQHLERYRNIDARTAVTSCGGCEGVPWRRR